MRHFAIGIVTVVILLAATAAQADSFTGSLDTPESTFAVFITLASAGTITIETYGFGGTANAPGGTNDAGQVIAAGGFDPMISLFSGSGAGASIVFDGLDPAASADTLSNYVAPCSPGGPASNVDLGGPFCGDARLQLSLAAGTYTLLLTDAGYIPLAVNPGPPDASTIGDGFTDLTGGVFQTCNVTDTVTCVNTTSDFALDVTGLPPNSTTSTAVPEPGTFIGLSAGLLALLPASRRRVMGR